MIWRLLSVAVFLLTAGGIGYLIWMTPVNERMSELEYTPSIAYLVQPNGQMAFALPMGLKKVRITSRLATENLDSPPTWWQGYQFHLRWKDIDGNVVHEQDYHERTRTSRFPSPEEEPYRRAFLAGIGEPLPDARITIVAGDTILPEGGSIEVSLPFDSPPLYFNATGEQLRSNVEAQQRILSLTTHQKDKLVRRLGMISWSMLNKEEQWALVQHEWKALAPKGQINKDFTSTWIMQSNYELPWSYPQLMGTTLSHQRALALNLVGPVTLRLSGPKEIQNLTLYTVADAADEAVVTPVTVEKDEPIGLNMEESGYKLQIEHNGPVSLHLKNTQKGDIGPVIFSVDSPKSEQFFGWTLGAMLQDLMPNSTLRERDTAIIGPEWWYAEYYETGSLPIQITPPMTDQNAELIVDIRAHLSSFDDQADRTITVIALDSENKPIWTRDHRFTPTAAPYEYYRPDDPERNVSTWISDRLRIFVPYTPEIRSIQLTSNDRLLVIPQTLGPPIGEKYSYNRPYKTTWLRFPRFAYSAYHRLTADNAAELDQNDQLVKIASNVRMESYPETKVKPSDITKFSPIIVDDEPTQWLVQTKNMTRNGPTFCKIKAGTKHHFRWSSESRQALQSTLEVTVNAPSPESLGSEYHLVSGQKSLIKDRLIQGVQRHKIMLTRNLETIKLDGPIGLTAWIKNHGSPDQICDTPRRSMGFWTLEPGQSQRVTFEKEKAVQRMLVTGLSQRDGVLSLTINDGANEPSQTVHEGWTEKIRHLEMPRTDRPVAYPHRNPITSAGILEARAIILKQDLIKDTHQISIKNIGEATIHFRLYLESDDRPTDEPGQDQWSFAELE